VILSQFCELYIITKDEQANTLKYLQEVAQSIGFGTEINSSKIINNWLSSFVTAREKCQKKVLLFMDFDELDDDKIVKRMCDCQSHSG